MFGNIPSLECFLLYLCLLQILLILQGLAEAPGNLPWMAPKALPAYASLIAGITRLALGEHTLAGYSERSGHNDLAS